MVSLLRSRRPRRSAVLALRSERRSGGCGLWFILLWLLLLAVAAFLTFGHPCVSSGARPSAFARAGLNLMRERRLAQKPLEISENVRGEALPARIFAFRGLGEESKKIARLLDGFGPPGRGER